MTLAQETLLATLELVFRKFFPPVLAVLAFLLTLWHAPVWWCGRGAEGWYAGDMQTQERLAVTVSEQVRRGLSADDFHTKSELFNGEWLFGTYLMAGIGFCQIASQHPAELARWRPDIERCIQGLLSPSVRAFDRNAWSRDALDSLDANDGHAAYLGYLNFLLSLYRQLDPGNRFAKVNDALTECLMRRADRSPNGLVATYPNEWYPVDNAPGLASVVLHGRATGRDHGAWVSRREAIFRKISVDPDTSLLIQAIGFDGAAVDGPRGSGTTLAVFFLSRALPQLAKGLQDGVERHLNSGVFGFGAIREFPVGRKGRTDIDSGPVVFGFGFSASGFGLAGARAWGEKTFFRRLYASAILAGAPVTRNDTVDFLTAGPLGNAILLAVLTTPRETP